MTLNLGSNSVQEGVSAKFSEVSAEVIRLSFQGHDVSFSVVHNHVYLQLPNSEILNINLSIHNYVFSLRIADNWLTRLQRLHEDSFKAVGA